MVVSASTIVTVVPIDETTVTVDPILATTIEIDVIIAVLTVKILQPSHEFTFGVGMTFVSYSLVLTPVV
jgi:hypothetical protein